MKTAETNAAVFNPAIPVGVDISIPTEAVCPNATVAAATNCNSNCNPDSDPTTALYTLRTHYSNVEKSIEPSAGQPLTTKNTQNQKMNAVHVATSNNDSVAPAPLPLRTQNSGLRTARATAANLTLKDLVPAALRDRRFRAYSFAASLAPEQRVQLFEWLGEDSLNEVKERVAAPAPEGFGLKVHRTTLQRLRNSVENVNLSDAVIDAMDSACDVLDPEIIADAAPLRETLSLLLYSRAVRTAQDADAVDLSRIISAITKLEKLKPTAVSRPQPARLKVDLTVSNAQREATIVQSVSATPEPAIESTPTLELQPAPTPDHKKANPNNPVHPVHPVQNPSPNPVQPVHSSSDPKSDHNSRSERLVAGNKLVAGLGGQIRNQTSEMKSAEIFQNCNLQTPPKPGQSGELEMLLSLARARGIDLASLDR